MKPITETNQVSFEKGMIENVKQESFGESLGSCLLLDNYNHTIEIGSVLKRTGEGTYLPTFMDNSKKYQGNLLTRYRDVVTGDVSCHQISEIVHSLVMNTANPEINDTFVLLLQNNNYPDSRCRVVGFVPYNDESNKNDKNTNLINWRNVHNPDDLISDEYKGWDIKGLYRCSAVYGESLAIGTQPDKLIVADTKNYFPLYIWKLMDLSKKREKSDKHFFNGISMNTTDYSQQRIFNVKYPKQGLRENSFCSIKGFNGYTNQWYDTSAPTGLTVIVVEEELRNNSFYSFDRWKTTDKFYNDNTQPMCYPNPYVTKWYQKGVKVVKGFELPTFPFVDGIVDFINNSPVIDNGNPIALGQNNQDLLVTKRNVSTNLRDIEILAINDKGTPFKRSSCESQDKIWHNDKMLFGIDGNDQFRGFSHTDVNLVERCVTFAMPDYISNNEPRCWTKGENIPMLVTANFGGHEVILSKLNYTVQGGKMAVPNGSAYRLWHKQVLSPRVLALRHYYRDGDKSIWLYPYCHENTHPEIRNDKWIVPTVSTSGFRYYHYLDVIANTLDSEFGINTHWYYEGESDEQLKYYPSLVDRASFGNTDLSDHYQAFYHEEVCPENYNALRITITLDQDMFDWCVANECTSIKVYIAKGDMSQKGHFKSIGTINYSEPPVGLYCKPVGKSYTDAKEDYSQYGLIKEFVIDGEGEVPREYEDKETFAITNLLRTNSWKFDNGYYWAVPVNDTNSGVNSGTPMNVLLNNYDPSRTGASAEENGYIKYRSEVWNQRDVLNYRTTVKDNVLVNLLADTRWTPDFYIQDYAYNAPTLELNTDGEYWDGLGCDVVSIIKGRAFIANHKEQAIVRYSAAQNGVILQDLFNKEDKITVGHETVTAMVEFREQLCVFNETSFYRITLPNIFDESTWEFLEAVKGQGTMSPKTICVTPYGFAFLNRNGIWFSQGGEAQNIGAVIQALYLHLATGVPYIFAHLYDPGTPNIDPITKFNNEMEIDYDSAKDEVVVSCSIFSTGFKIEREIRLIYNFKSQSWRVESFVFPGWTNQRYELKYDGTEENTDNQYPSEYPVLPEGIKPKLFVDRGKTHFDHNGLMVTRVIYNIDVDNPSASQALFEHAKQHNSYYVDIWYGWLPDRISGLLITHEIGDGQNDYVLHKVLLDAIARDRLLHDVGYHNAIFHEMFGYKDYFYNQNVDPMLFVELRNQGYITSNTQSRMVDLVPPNMLGRLSRAQNPFVSPSNTPFGNTGIEINSSSEAITLLAPMDAKFRRMRIRFASEIVAKVYGIQIQARVATRRFQ